MLKIKGRRCFLEIIDIDKREVNVLQQSIPSNVLICRWLINIVMEVTVAKRERRDGVGTFSGDTGLGAPPIWIGP